MWLSLVFTHTTAGSDQSPERIGLLYSKESAPLNGWDTRHRTHAVKRNRDAKQDSGQIYFMIRIPGTR